MPASDPTAPSDGLLVEARETMLALARANFAIDRDAAGEETLVGLSRSETNEVATLSLGALAGLPINDARRWHLLTRHRIALAQRRRAARKARQ